MKVLAVAALAAHLFEDKEAEHVPPAVGLRPAGAELAGWGHGHGYHRAQRYPEVPRRLGPSHDDAMCVVCGGVVPYEFRVSVQYSEIVKPQRRAWRLRADSSFGSSINVIIHSSVQFSSSTGKRYSLTSRKATCKTGEAALGGRFGFCPPEVGVLALAALASLENAPVGASHARVLRGSRATGGS